MQPMPLLTRWPVRGGNLRCLILFFSISLLLFSFLTACSPSSTYKEYSDQAESTPSPTKASNNPISAASKTDELSIFAASKRLPHDRVALARLLANQKDVSPVAQTTPLNLEKGETKDFWVTNMSDERNYSVTAELRYLGPYVLIYAEKGSQVDQTALEEAANHFETQIYSRTRSLFGSEWQPGVDGDSRIVILNTTKIGGGVIGYFSSRDSVPKKVNRFSNEHEMFYMNTGSLKLNDRAYLDILAHEFQHMIHWNEQRRSATWFNEGCATLSEDLNGFGGNNFTNSYLSNPNTQLTSWASEPGISGPHYGAANLFLRYFYAHYADKQGLKPLIRADAGNDLQAFVEIVQKKHPDLKDFGDLYSAWAIANLLNDPEIAAGRYSYEAGEGREAFAVPQPGQKITPTELNLGETKANIAQFGTAYFDLPMGPLNLSFTGGLTVNLVGALPHGQYAWWSGRNDNSVGTLTRAFNLFGLKSATLQFATWYELEKDYDYAFVTISTDNGANWETLRGQTTTNANPQDANYGNGLNGVSGAPGKKTEAGIRGQWLTEKMDLSPYVGQQILVRFWQINDEGFDAPGLLLDDLEIPELGYTDDVEKGPEEWQAGGFLRVKGVLPQLWQIRLLRKRLNGSLKIESLTPDEEGKVTAELQNGEKGTLIITGATPYTTELANYRLELTQP